MEQRLWFQWFGRVSRWLIFLLLGIAAFSLAALVLLVTADVLCRIFGTSIKGSLDLVRLLGALAVGCALPYTSAVKGHVAIEYFFQKLPRSGRTMVDTLARLLVIALCVFLTWRFMLYGQQLQSSNQVTPTLQVPIFWLPWVFALATASTTTVKIYHLLAPGRTMIKP